MVLLLLLLLLFLLLLLLLLLLLFLLLLLLLLLWSLFVWLLLLFLKMFFRSKVSQYEKCPRSKMFKRHINVIWKKRPGTPKQPDLNGMFGETPVVYAMTWSHPTKTTILKVDVWGTRSIYYLYKTLLVNLPFFLVNIYHPNWWRLSLKTEIICI